MKLRTVTSETIEKNWKRELASKEVDIWLTYSKDGDYAVDLKCKVCTKFEYKETNKDYQEAREKNFLAGDVRSAEQVKKKFEVAYFLAKEEMTFKKYPAILKLEEKHGVVWLLEMLIALTGIVC